MRALPFLAVLLSGCTLLFGGHGSSPAPANDGGACACETPPAADCVDATTLRSYVTQGTCANGGCAYDHWDAQCQGGCVNRACVGADPCDGIKCLTPPSATCDSSSVVGYAHSGICADGTCSYASTQTTCASGCAHGACTGDPCATVTCDQPPVSTCSDAQTLASYASTGTCEAGTCSYAPSYTTCASGCSGGACSNDPCAGITCDQPPATNCVNATTLRGYGGGTCSDGSCSYTHTDTTCSAPSNAKATCSKATCGFTCDAGYTASGSECVASDVDAGSPPLDMAAGAGAWIISGANDSTFGVDDDAVATLDGTQIFSNYGAGSEQISPINFTASPGQWVTMSFYNYFGGAKAHDAIWLSGPGITTQQVSPSFSGVGTSYPVDTVQPFFIAVFQIPAPGQTAAQGCLPDIALNTASWTVNPSLSIHTMTTQVYDATWTVNSHEYMYTPDCNGWVSDIFIAGDGSTATIGWNVITNQMRASATSGHTYNTTVAQTCASYAVQTLFPPGDLNLLTIQ